MSGGDRDELQLDLSEEELDAIIASQNPGGDSGVLDDDFLAGLNDLLGEKASSEPKSPDLGLSEEELELPGQEPGFSTEALELPEQEHGLSEETLEFSDPEDLEPSLPEQAHGSQRREVPPQGSGSGDDEEFEDLTSFLDEFEQGAAGMAPQADKTQPASAASGKTGGGGGGARSMSEKERKLELSESEMTGLSKPNKDGSKGIWVGLGIVLALAASGAALFVTFEVREQVVGVKEQMVGVQEQVMGISRSVDSLAAKVDLPPAVDPRLEEAVTAVRELSSQVGNISAIIEGPLSEAQTQGQAQLKGMSERLTALEQDVGVLRGDLDATRTKVARASAPPKEVVSIRADGAGAAEPARGGWAINLASYSTEGAADKGLAQFRKAGIAAEKYTANSQGKTWHRLRVSGFSSQEDAKRFGQELESKMGLSHTWVSRN